MAEAVAEGLRRGGEGPIVVHFDGAFHSDYGPGTAERVRRRVPNVKSVVMTAVPVERPASADPFPHAGRARFIIFTTKAPAARP